MTDDEEILRCSVCSRSMTRERSTEAALPGLDGQRRMMRLHTGCLAAAVGLKREGKRFPLREYYDRLESATDALTPEDEERAFRAYRARGERGR